jgi:imidazolonepropionase-like amidohydrolase
MSRLVQRRDTRLADVEKAPVVDDPGFKDHKPTRRSYLPLAIAGSLLFLFATGTLKTKDIPGFPWPGEPESLPPFIHEGMKRCAHLHQAPAPEVATHARKHSDRHVKGTAPVLLKNATLWTGEKDGTEVLYGADVWLEGGVIRKIRDPKDVDDDDDFSDLFEVAKNKGKRVETVNLDGAWVTPGIVDVHSHMGVNSLPDLQGSEETNSFKAPIQPWLRSLDGFNTHDAAFNLSIAGGITTMLVLPGSAGNIGGQAFTFKPRWTAENTPQSMQVEPPYVIRHGEWQRTRAWRHIKHACGENAKAWYHNARMDAAYDFRRAYSEGKKLKDKQDEWCSAPKKQKEPFPDSLEWEVMADIIRGHVKVNIHCYETVDLNDLVRVSNEFQFPIAAFHHAHEAYLVPGLLRQAWGKVPPAVAIFANNARYKREAYRGTPFAAKVLDEAGLKVVMKSDHPVLDSRFLIYEAAQAHAFGLEWNRALAAVTTTSATVAGLDHRLGFVRPGYDADLVVWDSFPLSVGATPKQTYIDGIPQIINPHVVRKPAAAQKITPKGDYDKEAAEAVLARGDPDLRPKKRSSNIVFQGVSTLYLSGVKTQGEGEPGTVVVENGKITCAGKACVTTASEYETIDLKGGSLAPGLISFGSELGLTEITAEPTTRTGDPPSVLDDNKILSGLLVHAADGAQFGGKDELMALREGITTGVTCPQTADFLKGMSYSFSLGARHALEQGAIGNPAAALHISLRQFDAAAGESSLGVATMFGILRRLLHGEAGKGEVAAAFKRVAAGELRLVVTVTSADSIGALIRLKRTVPAMRLTIHEAHEAWMLADELAAEDIGVIVAPPRAFPLLWDQRRILPGPPLSNMTLPAYLHSRGVKVGLGIAETCDARLTRFESAMAYASAPTIFSRQDAIDLVSANLVDVLGLNDGLHAAGVDLGFVAYESDMFSFEGRVRAVRAPGQEAMDLF